MFDGIQDRIVNQKKIRELIKNGKDMPAGPLYYWETGGDTLLPLVSNKDNPEWVRMVNRPKTIILGQSMAGEYVKSIYNRCEFRFIGFHMVPMLDTKFIKLKKNKADTEFFCLGALRKDRSHRQRFKDFLNSTGLDKFGQCRFQQGNQKMISYSDLETAYPERMLKQTFLPTLPSVELYNRTRYEIVLETFGFDPKDDTFDMSEKIFKPIIMKHPFMIVSTIGFLGNMKKLGFQTFGEFIDESYDTEVSEQRKFDIIGENIMFLKKQKADYFDAMEKICEHNYNLFKEIQAGYDENFQRQIDRIKNES